MDRLAYLKELTNPDYKKYSPKSKSKSNLHADPQFDHFDYDQAVCGSALYSCVDGNCGGKGKIKDNHGYTIFCSNPKCMASEDNEK